MSKEADRHGLPDGYLYKQMMWTEVSKMANQIHCEILYTNKGREGFRHLF